MHISRTLLRVRYAETDQMGVVYYANYIVWMEVGRVDYCKSVGISYEQMEREDGVFLAVSEAKCRYLYPARFDQDVEIHTRLEDAHPRMVRFAYEMKLAGSGKVLATGETKHVFCGKDLKPVRLPVKYRANFGLGV